MRVFILNTGRAGSTTIARACQHISNYTSGHETLAKKFGEERFQYPDNHIDADNRLSWHLGQMNEKFGDDAFYVHLKRNRDEVTQSHMNRYFKNGSIIEAFCEGIRLVPTVKMTHEQRIQACYDYQDTVDANIRHFLADKTKKMNIDLENIEKEFPKFWESIGAEGDFEKAMDEVRTKHNPSTKKGNLKLRYRFKLLFWREWNHLKYNR